jgi:N-methylhydantoinase B
MTFAASDPSGGAGLHRGGCATHWEVEPLDHDITVVSFGEGRHYPAGGANGALSRCEHLKLGRIERKAGDTVVEVMRSNAILSIKPGERVGTINPGGGGWGDPLQRPIAQVVHDVRNGYVSAQAAEAEYGVHVDCSNWTGEPTRLRG